MIDLSQPFQRGPGLDQNPASEQPRRSHHLDRRHGQAEGAGTGDDQDCDSADEGFPRIETKGPATREGRQRCRMDHRHIECRRAVGEPDVARARLGTRVNEARNGRQGRVLRACPGAQGQQA